MMCGVILGKVVSSLGGVAFSLFLCDFDMWFSGVECGGNNSAIARSFV